MNIIDIVIILFILMSGVVGFKKGAIKEAVSFIGTILVYVLAFILKNPVADIFCQYGPFFDFRGAFQGVTVLNIVIYHIIAFVLVALVLLVIYSLIIKVTGIIQKLVDFTLILTLPSKILGFIIGLLEGYVVTFLILLILALPLHSFEVFQESQLKDKVLYESPILSSTFGNLGNSIYEVYTFTKDFENNDINDKNLKTMDILLENKLITVESAEKIIETKKLDTVNGIEEVVNKYK